MHTDTETREQLIDLLEDFSTGMLVTRALNGDLRSRPMQLARSDDDGTLYFAASSDSAKAGEIHTQPEVNVVFQDDSRYLSISGRATLLDDRELIDELYAADWKIWFPEGKDRSGSPELTHSARFRDGAGPHERKPRPSGGTGGAEGLRLRAR